MINLLNRLSYGTKQRDTSQQQWDVTKQTIDVCTGTSDDDHCVVCGECGRDPGLWIQCSRCYDWFHCACSKLSGEILPFLSCENILYSCDRCLSKKISKDDNFNMECFKTTIKDVVQECVSNSIAEKLNDSKRANAMPTNVHIPVLSTENELKDDSYQKQVKIIGIPERDETFFLSRQIAEKQNIENLLNENGMASTVIDCYRRGKFVKGKTRPLIVTFPSVWDVRKTVSKSIELSFWKSKRILIVPELSPLDKEKEKAILKQRYDLIQSGVPSNELKIRKLKLFRNDKEV